MGQHTYGVAPAKNRTFRGLNGEATDAYTGSAIQSKLLSMDGQLSDVPCRKLTPGNFDHGGGGGLIRKSENAVVRQPSLARYRRPAPAGYADYATRRCVPAQVAARSSRTKYDSAIGPPSDITPPLRSRSIPARPSAERECLRWRKLLLQRTNDACQCRSRNHSRARRSPCLHRHPCGRAISSMFRRSRAARQTFPSAI